VSDILTVIYIVTWQEAPNILIYSNM